MCVCVHITFRTCEISHQVQLRHMGVSKDQNTQCVSVRELILFDHKHCPENDSAFRSCLRPHPLL